MANLIDKTFFIADINLPNLDNTGLDETLNAFIARYQEEVLTDLLGHTIAAEVLAAYNASVAQAPVPLPDNINRLLNGDVYTPVNGLEPVKWQGLINTTAKRSLIAYIVYFYFTRQQATHTGSIGEAKIKGEKSKPVSPVYKQVSAWNNAASWVIDFLLYMEVKYKVDFPNWQYYERTRHALRTYKRTNVFGI